ncbi:MAG TPA: tetraacyldisaccharide 4'-kinase [bacterium]|nr:tetraacyldisaccharide 4'-kinase [bacterium]
MNGRKRWEQRLWLRRGEGTAAGQALRSPLLLPAGVYCLVMSLRAAAYRKGWLARARLPARVIVAGNLSVGGTGKTPISAFIARKLTERGLRAALLTRGYGGRAGKGPLVVSEGRGPLCPAAEAGDEAILLARKLSGVPVIAGSDRAAAGELAVSRFNATHLVLDDGFQHLRIEHDCDVLVMNAGRDPAREYLLPRGPLREPVSAAARAHAIVLTGASAREEAGFAWTGRVCPGVPVFPARYRPLGMVSLATGAIRPVGGSALAFCGLGFPEGFFASLRDSGVKVVEPAVFPDHYAYGAEDVRALVARAERAGAARLVTTEKDAVKLSPEWAGDFPVDVFRMEPDLMGAEEKFINLVAGTGGEDGAAA